MICVRAPLSVFVAGLLGAGMVSLSGCGGGGGSTTDTGNATVQSIDAGAFLVPVDSNTKASHFQAIDTTGNPSDADRQLSIIDTDTHQVVKTFVYQGWSTTGDRFAVGATSGTLAPLGAGYLYMIQNGKVMQLDLSGATLGEPKQISSITNACYISGGNRVMAPDGKHAWLSVSVAGAPGATCRAPSAPKDYYVSSDMAATDVGPVAYGKYVPNGIQVVAVLTDGQLLSHGVLVLDKGTRRLYVASNDLQHELYSVQDNIISATEYLYFVGLMPNPQKGLLQAGNRLYVMDWSKGKLLLGDVVTTATITRFNYALAKDQNAAYVSDGVNLYAIADATSKLTTLAPIDTTQGTVQALYNTDKSVLVSQFNYFQAGGNSSLVAIDKRTGQSTAIFSMATDAYSIHGANGNAVVFSHYPSGIGEKTVVRYDVSTLASQTLFSASGTSFPTVELLYTPDGLDSRKLSDVIWFERKSNDQPGAETAISGYNLASAKTAVIGTIPASTVTPSANGSYTNFSTNWSALPSAVFWDWQLWQYAPAEVASLVKVLPPQQ